MGTETNSTGARRNRTCRKSGLKSFKPNIWRPEAKWHQCNRIQVGSMEAGSNIFQIYGVRWKAKNLCFAAISPHAAIQWEPRRRGPTDSSIYALVVLTIFSAVPKIDRHRNHRPSRISVSKFKPGILSHFPCVVHNSNSCLGCMGSKRLNFVFDG